MKAFITGVAGFAGSHLADLLLEQGHSVSGLDLAGVNTANLEQVRAQIHYVPFDPGKPESLVETLGQLRPDWIFHLAGRSNVAQSWQAREETLTANFFGTFRLLEAVRITGIRPAILMVGSGEQYGVVPLDRQPITESEPQRPRSPYAVSKASQELLSLQYIATDKLDIKLLRPFNHIGPRQQPSFVTADFARQVALIEQGTAPPVIRVGNLKAVRDFTAVHDMVRAYVLAIQHCEPGEPYNISSGVGTPIADVLDAFVSLARCPIKVELEPSRLRPVDVPSLVGDSTKFRRVTGWQCESDILTALTQVLTYWRERIAA